MSATNAPFGMRPVFHPSGIIRQRQLVAGIPSGYANTIYNGMPVKLVTAGQLQEVSATSDEFVGVMCGVTYTPSGSRPAIANFWPGGTALQANTTATVYFTDDPLIEYEIQSDGSVAQTAVAGGTNFSNLTNGSTLTGISQCTASATIAGSGNAQLRILDLSPYVDNNWGDAFVILRVLIALHQYTGNKAVI